MAGMAGSKVSWKPAQFGSVYEVERAQLGITERAAVKVIARPKDEDEVEQLYESRL